MRKINFLSLALVSLASFALASSQAPFPTDWKKFTPVQTPLMKEGGKIPKCGEEVKNLPEHYKGLMSTYCAVTPDGLGSVQALVSPSAVATYEAFSGKYEGNESMVMHLKDLKILFVMTYESLPKRRYGKPKFQSKPLYGVYDEDGKDVAGALGSGIHPNDCISCHSSSDGINGQMGKIEIKKAAE
ncbi:MAG: hypothetical protein QG567_878 [Campylobacterota bacterium]|nr:hypothetical protein [Campylobacterota bacterium]